MTSLLDQSALADLAERLVAAAGRAGADAADAVAVRSMSLSVEVRHGEGFASNRLSRKRDRLPCVSNIVQAISISPVTILPRLAPSNAGQHKYDRT